MTGAASDLHPVLDVVGNATYVLIGEASHGTHEFYATRAELTRRLIEDKGFNAVVIEGEWPDAYRVNHFVRGQSEDESAETALGSFDKYPEWMWPNTDVRDFVGCAIAIRLTAGRLWTRGSTGWICTACSALATRCSGTCAMSIPWKLLGQSNGIRRLPRPVLIQRAMERPSRMAGFHRLESRVKLQFDAVSQVTEQHRNSTDPAEADAAFDAQQNARLVQNAESYYRMYNPMVNTWNVRDEYMADTIDALAGHLRRRDGYARILVWAHTWAMPGRLSHGCEANGTSGNSYASGIPTRRS